MSGRIVRDRGGGYALAAQKRFLARSKSPIAGILRRTPAAPSSMP